ncbi:MAG: hypothetical protein AAFW73_16755 [Bacteroidota bacterium]
MKFFAGFMTGVLVTLIGVLLWLRSDVPAPATPLSEAHPIPAGFAEFYEQFHRDSTYQLTHISFPLAGIPAGAEVGDLDLDNFRWQRADWVLHRPFDDLEGQFERELLVLNADMVVEDIRGVDAQYGMQRRFSRLSDGWYLIYYAGMNKLASPTAEGAAAGEE